MKSRLLKKVLSAVIAGTAAFCLAACSGGAESEPAASDQTEADAEPQTAEEPETTEAVQEENAENGEESSEGDGGALIVYFSWSGNTEAVAQEIQSQTGADLFEIVRPSPIRMTMTNYLILHRKSRAVTPGRLSRIRWICQDMTRFFWDSPTGGETCR